LIHVCLELTLAQAPNGLVGGGEIVEQLQVTVDIVLEITGQIVDLVSERGDPLCSLRLSDPHRSGRGQDKTDGRHCEANGGQAREEHPTRKGGKSEGAHHSVADPARVSSSGVMASENRHTEGRSTPTFEVVHASIGSRTRRGVVKLTR
jgi:hypothetical protein